jgi:hypothetical protein
MDIVDIVTMIRHTHLAATIDHLEGDPMVTVHWDRAWIDPGGTAIRGAGPYLHVPVTHADGEETVHRVYPPARLRRRLARALPLLHLD